MVEVISEIYGKYVGVIMGNNEYLCTKKIIALASTLESRN